MTIYPKCVFDTAENNPNVVCLLSVDRHLRYIANLFGDVARACQTYAEAMKQRVIEENHVLPVTVDKLKKAFDHYDLDGSGVIEYNEFLSAL